MTDEILRGIAVQVANMAKAELRNKRELNGIIAVYNQKDAQPLFRMRKLEQEICELAGKDWLNNGAAKEAAFSLIREAMAVMPQDAIIVSTVINDFQQTDAFNRLATEKQYEVATGGNIWDHVKAGLFEPHDALMVTVQTAQRVCLFKQRMLGHLLVGEPAVHFIDQSLFGGRMKMFGRETSARTGTE